MKKAIQRAEPVYHLSLPDLESNLQTLKLHVEHNLLQSSKDGVQRLIKVYKRVKSLSRLIDQVLVFVHRYIYI